MPALAALTNAVADAPAGGAELSQVILATSFAMVGTAILFLVGLRERAGRTTPIGRLADFANRVSGLPRWVALPAAVSTGSLITALIGMYWDISLHVDNGRDPGPLANPSHYLILGGLFGIFAAGWLAMTLPRKDETPGPIAVEITRGWRVPMGGLLIISCASFSLIGFPLDDVWHRLFGQDVTLWGPTHLMLLTGAGFTLVGILVLLVEGRLASQAAGMPRPQGLHELIRRIRFISACGGLLIGLSIYQGEYDFGIPQFRLAFQPVLIALAASVALVVARQVAGAGAALAAVGFFIVVRGLLSVFVGPVMGEVTPHLPLYIAEGVIVEAVALAIGTARAYRCGIVAGAGIGTLGTLAEYGWSRVWMPIEWQAHMLPEAIALATAVAIAGGVLGTFIAGGLRLRPEITGVPRAWAGAVASLLVVGAVIGYLLVDGAPAGRAIVTLTEVQGAPDREVNATVRFVPASLAKDADWVTTIAWQGGVPRRVDPLRRVGDGVYETTAPLPVSGSWKTAIRLHRGQDLASVPVYMPRDEAIPAEGVPAPARFERALEGDREMLQRERKDDTPAWLWAAACLFVLAIALTLIGLIGWGLSRLSRASAGGAEPTPEGPAGPDRERARARELAGAR